MQSKRVSKPTPKRNVLDSPDRSAVLAALIHGATVYAVGSVDASGAACEELGYELEMHVWQAELARTKLVEELSGYRDRDQVLAQTTLQSAYTPSTRHRRLGREMQVLLMRSIADSWIETHQWLEQRWVPPALYNVRKLARSLQLPAEAVDRLVDESPASIGTGPVRPGVPQANPCMRQK